MSLNVTVPIDELEGDVRSGAIDTVLAVFADHHGRMIGKRAEATFFFDTVLEQGTENCDYLIACDLDYTPLPGFRWASYEQGYGDMRGVVDPTTIRYLPWLDRTALVFVDLVDVSSGEPVEVSPRRILQRQAAAARDAGFAAKCGSEIEFFLFKQAYDDAHADDYRHLTPNSRRRCAPVRSLRARSVGAVGHRAAAPAESHLDVRNLSGRPQRQLTAPRTLNRGEPHGLDHRSDRRIAATTGLDPEPLLVDPETAATLLDLAGFAAHDSGERTNAPLLCFVFGQAVARGATLTDLERSVRASGA